MKRIALLGVVFILVSGQTYIPGQTNTQPVDRSGTITLGGTAQQLMAANTQRHGCSVQNQSTGDLWINDLGGTASAIQPSKWIPAGSEWTCSIGGTSLLAMSIFGGTTGQAFMAQEW